MYGSLDLVNILAFPLSLTSESRACCPQLSFFCNLQEVGLLDPGYVNLFQPQAGGSIPARDISSEMLQTSMAVKEGDHPKLG